MSMSRLWQVSFLAAVLLAGCANYTKPVATAEPLTVRERNFEAVWQAAQDVLTDYNFRLERLDRREGLIVTEPLTGQQAWEFWRRDAVTPYALAESTLQTIYRQAQVRIVPISGEVNLYEAEVQANTYRSSRRSQLGTTSAAYGMFLLPGGNSSIDALAILGYERTLEGLPGFETTEGEAVGDLVGLGPDVALAAKLSSQINLRADQLRGKQN